MFNFSGLVAVITGGSSGLGVQFARALAGHGADLALIARRKEKLTPSPRSCARSSASRC